MQTFTLIFDPWCGWCYGAEPGLERLRQQQPQAQWQLLPSGLFCEAGAPPSRERRDYFWQADQRIARLTGQPFTETYHRQILQDDRQHFDSSLATLTWYLLQARLPEKSLAILHAVQRLRYVDGDVSPAAHAALASNFGVDTAEFAQQLAQPWPAGLVDLVNQARQLMQQHGIGGVPALLLDNGNNQRIVPSAQFLSPAHA